MRHLILLVASVPFLSGCTSMLGPYLYRPTNYTPVPQGGAAPTVATLSLDASRRLMIAQLNPQFTCSEPPPDAAASLLAKAAVEASAKPTAGGEFGGKWNDEFQANMLAISARTAAVEFWRTTSFSYCLLLMNHKDAEAQTYLSTAERVAPTFGTPKPKE